jgi:hypothetical protein
MSLLHSELVVIVNAYLFAGIPIGFAVVAGHCSPLYRLPWGTLARWWSRMACIVVSSAAALALLG